MVHTEFFTKTVRWRLVLLLLWTVLVCSILYASSGRSVSSVLREHAQQTFQVPSRLKRVAGKAWPPLEQCKKTTTIEEDAAFLKRAVLKQEGEKSWVHCSVLRTCDDDSRRPYRAHCFIRECRAYTIRLKKSGNTHNVVSATTSTEELSRVVESTLRGKSFTAFDDLESYIDVSCQDPKVPHLKLTGDVLSAPRCHARGDARARDRGRKTVLARKISVLYFRYLSHWELPFRFPGLFSLIDVWEKERNASVVRFDKHQATRWADDEALSLLLQGRVGPFLYAGSLLDVLHRNNYCFRVGDFSCDKSREQESLIKNASSHNPPSCSQTTSAQAMADLCGASGNATDSEIRAALTSLLWEVHDVDGGTGEAQPVISLSVINTRDWRSPELLDHTLMNVLSGVLGSQGGRSVLLVSDVGSPVLLRLDLSVRLQTQASNPALLLLSTSPLPQHVHSLLPGLQRAPFSMIHVHRLLTQLVNNNNNQTTPTESPHTPSLENGEGGEEGSCGRLRVRPPFTCLCEGQYVPYPNDTLMAGFAELAVSLINSRLRHVQPPYGYTLRNRPPCATMSAVSFSNVLVGSRGNRRRVVMDLVLENDLYRDRAVRSVALDLWDLDTIPKSAVQVFRPQPQSSYATTTLIPTSAAGRGGSGDSALRTLCQSGERLDPRGSSEAALLRRWSQERHVGRRGKVTHVHDSCLYLLLRDLGDSLSVQAANVCGDRRYDLVLHPSLLNMLPLSPLPLSASLGPRQRLLVVVVVKLAYTVPTFAYRLHPDFRVTYDV